MDHYQMSPSPWQHCGQYITDADGHNIAMVNMTRHAAKNAAMLAAAPELYYIAEKAVVKICSSCQSCVTEDDKCLVKSWKRIVEKACGK